MNCYREATSMQCSRTVASASNDRGSGGSKGKISRWDGDPNHKHSDGVQVHASGHQRKSSPGSRHSDNPNPNNESEQVKFTIFPTKLLSIIQSLLGFEWSRQLHGDPKHRDKSRFYEYHKGVEPKTNSCFRLRRILNYLVSKGHL